MCAIDGSIVVAVTGANGLVGSAVCAALSARGAEVRAVVRRAGSAPRLPGITEVAGDFTDAAVAAEAAAGAFALVSTVHPMGSDRDTQHRVGVLGTSTLARASVAAGVERFVHVSTAAVYDRSPGVGDVDESSSLVGDGANDYAVTKRDTDLALAQIGGITRILLRPPAILGPGPSSVWNTVRPAEMREHPEARRAVPAQTFAWVHLTDLASLAADLAAGVLPDANEPASGPVHKECTAVNVAGAAHASLRDYMTAACGALGVEPIWEDAPAWTGRILTGRARGWGWAATVDLPEALSELVAGLPH